MEIGEVARVDSGGNVVFLCRQTATDWTVSQDRWETGARQLSAAIAVDDSGGEPNWRVVAMPGRRNRRDVRTWAAAIDIALNIH